MTRTTWKQLEQEDEGVAFPRARRTCQSLLAALLLATFFLASDVAGQVRSRIRAVNTRNHSRGAVAFHYAPSLSAEALAWYSRFDVLVTHDPLPREQVAELHAAGTKVLFYEWAVAFYGSRATAWQRALFADGRNLLNHTPLHGGAGSETAAAWYFDPMSPEHELGRAEEIVRRLRDTGYDGVFFDTTTVASVHPEARAEYEIRHPHVPYDAAFARFLSQLRSRLPSGLIFTNQGYRSAEHYLPYVDWDLTESLITGPQEGSYQLRSWNDPALPWSSTYFVIRTMIEPLAARYPHVRFAHLNYASGSNAETVRVVVAAAQLFGTDAYVAAPTTAEEVDPIYFRAPGKPVSPRQESANGQAAWRFFENGLIVVTAAPHEISIPQISGKRVRTHVTGELHCGDTILIPAATHGTRAYFFDSTRDCGL
jgi:hypothetical protein